MAYKDYILTKAKDSNELDIYEAAGFETNIGDDLLVLREDGPEIVTAIGVQTIDQDDAEEKLRPLLDALKKNTQIKRALARVRYHFFKYEEDSDDKWE